MRKVIVNEWMSLEGVAQAPGAAEEETSRGFEHGGWHLRYFLGGGKRVFSGHGALKPLRLVDSEVTTTGAILATCASAPAVRSADSRGPR